MASDEPGTRRARTLDVQSDTGSFTDLLLPPQLVSALAGAGFVRPSPVQKAAIPIGRLGSDLIVQAKSGTGKTVVFAAILLERTSLDVPTPQGLVLAPTRELAIQSHQVIQRIAAGLPQPAPSSAVLVGGLPTADDEKRLRRTCHIAVGTPGRVCALAASGALLLGRVRCLVLDEADELLADAFYPDVSWLAQQLPAKKQVLAFSATFTPALLADLEPLMRRPQKVMLCEDTVSLLGIRQFHQLVPLSGEASGSEEGEEGEEGEGAEAARPPGAAEGTAAGGEGAAPAGAGGGKPGRRQEQQDVAQQASLLQAKVEALLRLLFTLSFHQAAVFCNRKPTAEWLTRRLTAAGCPAAHLSSDLPQPERMAAVEAVRAFKVRVIVSTDVMARGVDFDRVNLVVNVDLPPDAATYVHRVGRTGRFGSRGVAVALVSRGELRRLRAYLHDARGGAVEPLPEVVPEDLYSFELETDWERQARQALLEAPTGTPPASPPPLHRQQRKGGEEGRGGGQGQRHEEEEQEEEEEEEGGQLRQLEQQWGSCDAAAAWDAWAQYYRSQGYSYPHANPYRQQQQQQHSPWEGDAHFKGPPSQPSTQGAWSHSPWQHYHHHHHHQQQQQQYQPHHQQHHHQHRAMGAAAAASGGGDAAAAGTAAQPAGPALLFQRRVSDASDWGGVNRTPGDEAGGSSSGVGSSDGLPSSDEAMDARALQLLARLQLPSSGSPPPTAQRQPGVSGGGGGGGGGGGSERRGGGGADQQLAAQAPQQRAAAAPPVAQAGGGLCYGCWAAAYAAWWGDYEAWRHQVVGRAWYAAG